MKYVLFFPGLDRVHENKDVGMFPIELAKKGNDVKIVTDVKRDLKEIQGCKIVYLNDNGIFLYIKFILFLFKNRKTIDVLQQFHFSKASALLAFIFKLMNKQAINYLKMDADYRNLDLWKENSKNSFRKFLYKISMASFELITIETKIMDSELKKLWPFMQNKLKYLPNGLSFTSMNNKDLKVEQINREFLFVGRVGAFQKATDVLIAAFEQIADRTNYSLKLIGPMEESFKSWIKEKKVKESVMSRIEFGGNITNRNVLRQVYKSSAVFVFPSRWESSGLALVEAAGEGNYIIGTDVGVTREVIEKTGFGGIVGINQVDELANAMLEATNNEDILSVEKRTQASQLIRDSYNYEYITENLVSYIQNAKNKFNQKSVMKNE